MRLATQNGRPIYASDEVQREEAIRATLAHIQTLDDITVRSGAAYKIMAFGSEVYHVYDARRPILVDQVNMTFSDSKTPTTEVILQRPLRGISIPNSLRRPFDLHPDLFSEWSHGCVVQMLYKSITRKSQAG